MVLAASQIGNLHAKVLALSLMVLCAAPCLAHEVARLKEAEAAINAKRYAQAAKSLEPLAHDGNPRAEWLLGDLYAKGHGVRRDYNKARDLWEKATASGDRDAMCSLAGILSIGFGGPADPHRAVALVQKSASLGCSKAQYGVGAAYLWGWETAVKQNYSQAVKFLEFAEINGNGNAECLLGFMHENGFGVSKDRQRAMALMKAAKLHGCADGEWYIGKIYSLGRGDTRQDYAKASFWFNKAVADGNESAMNDLGWLYLRGQGVQADNKKALQLFLKAERHGDPFAKYSLAEMYRTGAGCPKDLKKAEILYSQLASFGERKSLDRLNTMGRDSVWQGVTRENYVRAAKYFQSTAKAEDGNGECWLAYLYENGFGVPKDQRKAAALMKLAKVHGCAEAEYDIGRNYSDGLGVRQDYAKAYYWLSKAVADGNPHAMNQLAQMYRRGLGVKVDEKKALELEQRGAENGCPTAKYNMAERYRMGDGVTKDLEKAKDLYQEAAKLGETKSVEKLKLLSSQTKGKAVDPIK